MRKALLASFIVAVVMVAGCDKFKPRNPFGPSSVNGSKNHSFEEVWFTPNVGSKDLADMFTKPDLWPVALENITAFSFYGQHLSDGGCDICGPNNMVRLREVDAFRFLARNNIKIVIETGSLKPHNCNNIESAIAGSVEGIFNIQTSGGRVAYIAMDEPFMSGLGTDNVLGGGPACGFTVEQSAEKVKTYILGVNGASPGTRIGLIEPYPYFSVEQIKSFILALEKTGVRLPFFHLDFDAGSSGIDARNDIQDLRNFCKARGIAFGIIIIGGDGTSNNSASGGGMLMARRIDGYLGLSNQDHLLFQSWLDYPPMRGKQDLRLYPENLPESSPVTMTGMLNEILRMVR